MLRFLFLTTLVTALAGCTSSPNNCSANGCPRATGNTRLLSGSVVRTIAGEAPRTLALVASPAPTTPDACSISGLGVEVFQNEFVNGTGPILACPTGSDRGFLDVLLTRLGDVREFALGTRTVAAGDLGIVAEICVPTGDRGCNLCKIGLEDTKATVTVEEATGGKAAYPKLVTSDYKRVFRVEVDTGVRSSSSAGGACPTVATKLVVRFEQTAADWRYDPNGPCLCE